MHAMTDLLRIFLAAKHSASRLCLSTRRKQKDRCAETRWQAARLQERVGALRGFGRHHVRNQRLQQVKVQHRLVHHCQRALRGRAVLVCTAQASQSPCGRRSWRRRATLARLPVLWRRDILRKWRAFWGSCNTKCMPMPQCHANCTL